MTRSSSIRLLSGLALTALLTSCAGSGAGVDPAADAAAASAAEHSSGPAASTGNDSAGGGSTGQDGAGNPGGPGGGADGGGGGGGTDVEAGGNPGAPGDVTVFEESEVAFGPFRDEGSGHRVCVVEGKCTLADPVKDSGEADPQTGLDNCLITTFEYSSGTRPNPDPSESREVFTEGATVTPHVRCDPVSPEDANTNGTDGTGDGSDTSGDTGNGSDTSGDTGDQQPPADGSQG